MRQWRVGTLSMGLLLLASGIGLLYAQFNKVAAADWAFKWWPVIFIILGVEVLIQFHFRKSEDGKIKYDVFSVFIILLIVLAGLGLQSASEVGLVEYAREMINMQDFNLQSPETVIPVNNQVQKIVVESEYAGILKIRTASSNSILYYCNAALRAQSEPEARNYLQKWSQINTHQTGDTLYLSMSRSPHNNRTMDCSSTLVLPENIAVEIDHRDVSVQLSAGNISSDWVLKGDSPVTVTLPSTSDLLVTALTSDTHNLRGNLNWTTLEGKPLLNSPPNEDENPNMEDNISENNSENKPRQVKSQLGNGSHKLTVVNDQDISITILP
jgi:hypothetical protein